MNSTNNTKGYSIFGTTSLAILLQLLNSTGANAQVLDSAKKQEIFDAYKSVEDSVNFNAPLNRADVKTLETFLGSDDYLYIGSSSGLQTMPESGANSILRKNNYAWVKVVQVGSGYGKFKAENNRDESFTYAIYANRAGYNGYDSEKTDDRLKEIIYMNNRIAPEDITIQRDNNGNILDIMYTGDAKDVAALKALGVSKTHQLIGGRPVEVNHILMERGKTHVLLLEDLLEIAGADVDSDVSSYPYNKGNKGKKNQKKEREYFEDEVGGPRRNIDKDSVEYRVGVLGTFTDMGVPGVAGFIQLGREGKFVNWDVELGASIKRLNSEYGLFTEEQLTHPTLNYNGVSQLDEAGKARWEDVQLALMFSRHFGKSKAMFWRAGISADIATLKYDGKEERTTYFEGPNGSIIDYDNHFNNVAINETEVKLNPVIGLGFEINRMRFAIDYQIPLNKISNPKYFSGPDQSTNMGQVKFSIGFNLGQSKIDREQLNARYSKRNGNNTRTYYHRGVQGQ